MKLIYLKQSLKKKIKLYHKTKKDEDKKQKNIENLSTNLTSNITR